MDLGLCGHIGITAYFGLLDIAQPRQGETFVVSGAAGAAGSLVGQLARISGCRVVGIAGSQEKCRWITQELGFDAAVNYREEKPLDEALTKHCPHGIDVYFNNVGGETLEAALNLINLRGRIALCGMISGYNETGRDGHLRTGPGNLGQLIIKRVRMEGFLCLDYRNRACEAFEALGKWYQEGKVKYRVHVIEGLKNAPAANEHALRRKQSWQTAYPGIASRTSRRPAPRPPRRVPPKFRPNPSRSLATIELRIVF
jgi:NADPH-dependent curcumin reductase CurA